MVEHGRDVPFHDMTPDDLDPMLDVHLKGALPIDPSLSGDNSSAGNQSQIRTTWRVGLIETVKGRTVPDL